MKGTRPLTREEILKVSKRFSGTFEVRNRSLFMLGVSVGGRISELLALTIGDVWQNRQPVTDLLFEKDIVKGKETARIIPVNADGQKAIKELIDWHRGRYGNISGKRPLFPSRKFGGALGRTQAHRILVTAFNHAGLNGKLATHSLRKSFAQRIYDATGDIFLVKELLGHKSVETTKKYIGVSYSKMQAATAGIEVHRSSLLLHSAISDVPTHDLLKELKERGFDIKTTVSKKTERVFFDDDKVVVFPNDRFLHEKDTDVSGAF